MNREERKRKFNEAIVNMLYPPPPQPDPPSPQVKPLRVSAEGVASHVISDGLDDCENSSRSGDDGDESEQNKLSRAQRKRIRKKKLKEEATCRGKFIGPLLIQTQTNLLGDSVAEGSPAARSNASEENSAADEPGLGLQSACANSNKVKHRRSAKRMAKEKLNSSNYNNSNQLGTSTSPIDPKEAH